MTAATPAPLPSDQISELATSAYIYGYPLIIMEMTRRVSTNVADASHFGKAPMNQFGSLPAFPDATFTDVVRPNADTLYSLMWFDVSQEPLMISVPDSGGRYYLLEMLDMWTDVFASPGKRTTGTNAQTLGLVGPGWQGDIPSERCSSSARPRLPGSSGARRPTAKRTTMRYTNFRPVSPLRRSANGVSRIGRRRERSIPIGT